MTKRRVCRLDELDIWRVEYLARVRWPFSLFIAPRWLPVRKWTIFLDALVPMEYDTHIAAVAAIERLERIELEMDARNRNDWRCYGQ